MTYTKLLLLNIFFISSAQAVIYLPNGVTLTQVKNSPQKRVAWDIHEVLAKKNTHERIFVGLKNLPHIFKGLGQIAFSKITGITTNADESLKIIKSLPQYASGEAYVEVFSHNNQPELAAMAQDIANTFRPMPGIPELIEEIHQKGFTQQFASNIGPKLLQELKEIFRNKYDCTMLDLIQPGKVVDYSKYGPLGNAVISAELATVNKPDRQFFCQFNDTYNQDKKYTYIFIDDKLKNIQSAVKEGFVGIHFECKSKDALAKLRTDLKNVGILT